MAVIVKSGERLVLVIAGFTLPCFECGVTLNDSLKKYRYIYLLPDKFVLIRNNRIEMKNDTRGKGYNYKEHQTWLDL